MFTNHSKKSVIGLSKKGNEKDQPTIPRCSLVIDDIKIEISFLTERRGEKREQG